MRTPRLSKFTACAVVVAAPIFAGVIHSRKVSAQITATSQVAFEAAAIKLNTTGASGIDFETQPGGRLNIVNNPLSNVIRNAFNSMRPFVLQGGPDWINSDRYDIEAKAEGNPAEPQMIIMLQALLADRFRLKVHEETRELPVYSLTVAKGGPKLQQFKEGSCVTRDRSEPAGPPAGSEAP